MIRHYFLCSQTAQPSLRWRDAFPDGVACERDALSADIRPSDLIWVPTALREWETHVRSLAATRPENPIAVVSFAPDDDEGICALDSGARAYCHALSVPAMLREVAAVMSHGGMWIGAALMARVLGAASRLLPAADQDARLHLLSSREAEVARAAAAGLSNKEIAATLGITERTVKAHMGAVFEKLGVRDRLQLVLSLSTQGSAAGVG